VQNCRYDPATLTAVTRYRFAITTTTTMAVSHPKTGNVSLAAQQSTPETPVMHAAAYSTRLS